MLFVVQIGRAAMPAWAVTSRNHLLFCHDGYYHQLNLEMNGAYKISIPQDPKAEKVQHQAAAVKWPPTHLWPAWRGGLGSASSSKWRVRTVRYSAAWLAVGLTGTASSSSWGGGGPTSPRVRRNVNPWTTACRAAACAATVGLSDCQPCIARLRYLQAFSTDDPAGYFISLCSSGSSAARHATR